MADLGGTFDANDPANKKPNNVIPKGHYPMVMIASEKAATKDNTGHYLKCTFQIVSGEFQNRQLFQNLNLWLAPINDKKKEAIQIAKGQFSELCRAINVLSPTDSAQLHNKKFIGVVTVKGKEEDEYGIQNNITGFKPYSKSQSSSPPPQMKMQPTSSPDATPPENVWG